MAHQILAAKLCELDQKIGRLHSRIRLCETEDPEEIRRELDSLRRECQVERGALRDRMRFSRSPAAARIAGTFDQIAEILERARQEARREAEDGPPEGTLPVEKLPEGTLREKMLPEERILLAEYMLDFALQSADEALLASLEAIEGQLAWEADGRPLSGQAREGQTVSNENETKEANFL